MDLQSESHIVLEEENAKLKFEIERLLQSEKWYKAKYKKYKLSRLDILEKYYSSDKNVAIKLKFMKDENNKLKEELFQNRRRLSGCDCKTFQLNTTTLECRKLQRTIDELRSVNGILRKQIDQLLSDSHKVSTSHDSRALLLADLTRKKKILCANLEKSNFEMDLLTNEVQRMKFEREIEVDQLFQLKKNWLEIQDKMGHEIVDTKQSKIKLLKILLDQQNRNIHKTSEEVLVAQDFAKKMELIISELNLKSCVIDKQVKKLLHLKSSIKSLQNQNNCLEEKNLKQTYLYTFQVQEFNAIYFSQKKKMEELEKYYEEEIHFLKN